MGNLIDGDDGLPAEEVGPWAKDKLDYLARYITISSGVRKKFILPRKAGATYIDLFCGPGRSRIGKTTEFIDGSPVAAWKAAGRTHSPFTSMIIGDLDPVRLDACATRLRQLGAPVQTVLGPAHVTVGAVARALNPSALHFAFLDPYNLKNLDFAILETLSRFERMDVLVHVSTMDFQRNLDRNLTRDDSDFDRFAPGWREALLDGAKARTRSDLLAFWRDRVAALGIGAADDVKLITGTRGQRLYWLTLVARHELAHRFWKISAARDQKSLFD